MYSFTMKSDRVEVCDIALPDSNPLKTFSISYKNLSEVFDTLSSEVGGRTSERSMLLPEGCVAASVESDRIYIYEVFQERTLKITHQSGTDPARSFNVPFPRTYIKSLFVKHSGEFKFSKMWILMSADMMGVKLARMPFPNIYSGSHEVCMGTVGRSFSVTPTDLRMAGRVYSMFAESVFNNDLWSPFSVREDGRLIEFGLPIQWFEFLEGKQSFPYGLFNFSVKGLHLK